MYTTSSLREYLESRDCELDDTDNMLRLAKEWMKRRDELRDRCCDSIIFMADGEETDPPRPHSSMVDIA